MPFGHVKNGNVFKLTQTKKTVILRLAEENAERDVQDAGGRVNRLRLPGAVAPSFNFTPEQQTKGKLQ
jgi:hypothetical protein